MDKRRLKRTGLRPGYRKDTRFADTLAYLDKAQATFSDRSNGSRCQFPMPDGVHCGEPAADGHTVQKAILRSISENGHVMSFLRDVSTIKQRLITADQERGHIFWDQLRWSPGEIGVQDASVQYFTCQPHDTSLFRPIEHKEGGSANHPLDRERLTSEQHFLFVYRILMLYVEQLERSRIIIDSLPGQHRSERRVVLSKARLGETTRRIKNQKEFLDRNYLQLDFDSSIYTPLEASVTLPLRLAMSDHYTFDGKDAVGEVFLTVLPIDQSRSGNHAYYHRVLGSSFRGDEASNEKPIDAVRRMLDNIGKSDGDQDGFLTQVLTYCRNSYFSHDYHQLSEEFRIALEQAVHKQTSEGLPPPIQEYL